MAGQKKNSSKVKFSGQIKDARFRECPACYGPIDYFNTCRHCGRKWTPELSETEKKERAEGIEHNYESDEEDPAVEPVGVRETLLGRDEDEIIGKKARRVGARKRGLPSSFKKWEIQDADSDAIITRKRSLMRLDSRKIYNQMGLSVRAYQTQKNVMIWLTRLYDFLDEEEREAFAPTAEFLKQGLIGLAEFSSKKVNLATQMEELVQQETRKARVARRAQEAIASAIRQTTRTTNPGADTEGLETVMPEEIDPEELLEQVKKQLALREKPTKISRFDAEFSEEEN